ncbi:KDGP aldolase [Saccharococcus caldoxylosilyticus]|uniref:KDGP aldolase n=1 Tax=Saccharococcus caldoxylosilyticus TaxID=81408 RepID=UPI0002E8149E|nr:KDGP aldolase [Parageobacillus caldoxylosilyticus]
MRLFNIKRFQDQLLLNVLAKDGKNAADLLEASDGFCVPGIAAADFATIEEAVETVKSIKQSSPVVSIGLGGGGKFDEWKRVVDIAVRSNPEHINQPLERALFAKGFLAAKQCFPIITALISPSGEVGFVKIPTGKKIKVEPLLELAAACGVESIKVMPMKGLDHLEELLFIAKEAAKRGIRAIEPAGGIKVHHLPVLYKEIRKTNIELFMPHVFRDVLQGKGESNPSRVKEIFLQLKGVISS